MITELFEVTCADCATETTVTQTTWPATRIDPADGETTPEECPKCGLPFSESSEWILLEPDEVWPVDAA